MDAKVGRDIDGREIDGCQGRERYRSGTDTGTKLNINRSDILPKKLLNAIYKTYLK